MAIQHHCVCGTTFVLGLTLSACSGDGASEDDMSGGATFGSTTLAESGGTEGGSGGSPGSSDGSSGSGDGPTGSGDGSSSGDTTGGEPTPDCHDKATGTMVDARDGKAYCTVMINGTRWLAENLRYVPEGDGHWCPDEDAALCDDYGVLYWWTTAVGVEATYLEAEADLDEPLQGVCPSGWHLPTHAEWLDLLDFVTSDNQSEGPIFEGKLGSKYLRASTDDWLVGPTTVPAENKYGFWGLPAGVIGCVGPCSADGLGRRANFWSSTEVGPGHAVAVELRSDENARVFDQTTNSNPSKDYGRSIRCIED